MTVSTTIIIFACVGYYYISSVESGLCKQDQLKCPNNNCISKEWICDGYNDCGDNSDESDCPCSSFYCRNPRKCIPKQWVCNGENNCGDNSDENCGVDFFCKNKKIIKGEQVCDGTDTCGDNSDENGCGKPSGAKVLSEHKEFIENQTFSATCIARCMPPCTFRWTLGNDENINGNYLYIPSLSAADENVFTCKASNTYGTVYSNMSLDVKFGPRTEPTVNISNTNPVENEIADFKCTNVDCNPTCVYNWYKNGHKIELDRGKKIQYGDTGIYHCEASNGIGKQMSEFYNVTVQYGPQSEPKTYISNVNPSIEENVTFTCENVDCNPQCNLTWLKDGEVVETDDHKIMTYRDSGIYQCKATNPFGSKTSTPKGVIVQYHTPLVNSTARSDITCNSDNIKVFLPIALLPKVSNVTWLDPSCHIFTNRTHFVSSLPHTSCGTTVTLTDNNVIFENQIIAQTGNTKTDDRMLNFGLDSHIIPVKCIYPRQEMAMTSYQPVQPQITFYEKQFGHLNIDMKQFSSNRFDRALEQTPGPRKLTLNSDIYVKVNLHQSNKSNLGMRLDACIVTKTPSPYDSIFYKLVQDGCPTAKFVHIYTSPANEARFKLKAFEFTSNRSNIMYIHCQTSVCMKSSPHCAVKCFGSDRQRRDVTSDKSHLLSMGPLVFVADAETNASLVAYIMAGTFAGVAFIAIVVAIVGWRR